MGKIYDSAGWVNWPYIINRHCAFNMIVGARGVGKTYGLMKECILAGRKFIYLRRLKSQLDQCVSADGNPFKRLNTDNAWSITPKRTTGGVLFQTAEGDLVSVGVALSTVANVRGFDYSDFDCIIFDEAVASDGERPINHEFEAFLNFYETVNRNRELAGEDPVQCFLLGNANRLTNPYYSGWHFMRTALKMIQGRQMVWRSGDGTRLMVLLLDSRISARKADTALYANASTGFLSMALDNAFRTDATQIRSMPLAEFNHVVSIGDIGIYRHKSKRLYYVSSTAHKSEYEPYGISLKMFQNDFYSLRLYYLIQKIVYFENYECELIFRELFLLT